MSSLLINTILLVYVFIERKLRTKFFYFRSYELEFIYIFSILECTYDDMSEHLHLWSLHTTSGYGGCSYSYPRWIQWFSWIKRNHVFIGTYSNAFECRLCLFSRDTKTSKNIKEYEVIIGPTRYHSQSFKSKCPCQSLSILDNLFCILLKTRFQSFFEGNCFRCDQIFMRSSLYSRKYRPSDFWTKCFFCHDNSSTWTTKGLMCRCGYYITVGDWIF